MSSETRGLTLVAVVSALALPLVALGEGAGGVAGSGMEQGSGAISARSDVEMSVESLRGTSRARLGAVGQAVSTKLTAIRACYSKVASVRPTKEGLLRIEVRVPEGKARTTVDVAEDQVGDRELTDCIVKALKSADYSAVPGPAGGLVIVDVANTAAKGARIVAEEREHVPLKGVKRTADGRPELTASTEGGEVTITITGEGETTPEAVVELNRAVQARLGTLLDARRRAARRGADPSGEAILALRVGPRGAATGREVSSTIGDRMAPGRILGALRAATRGNAATAGSFRVRVVFAGN